MVQDFAKRPGLSLKFIKKTDRKRKYQSSPANGYLKITGLVTLIALVAGGTAFFWFGRRTSALLEELSGANAVREQLVAQREALFARRNTLMSREYIEGAAAKLNLFPPTPEQTRRP